MVKKRIWLINYYAMPPKLESRLRTIKFAKYLKQKGYDVVVISSSVMHNKNQNLILKKEKFVKRSYDGIDFIHIKSLNYNTNGLKRFTSLLFFHIRLHLLRNRFQKPDVIIHTALPPFGNITYFTSKRLKSKYIVEVLDLWPESFVSFGLIKKYNPLLFFAYKAEKWLYKKADKIVFSMEGGKDYIIDKKWDIKSGGKIDLDKVYYINNGVDIKDFERNKIDYVLDDFDLNNDNFFKVTYLGSIRLANNLKSLIEAANILKEESNLKFLIYGDGGDRLFLENYCKENKIYNVVFKEKWVDPEFVPYILSKSNLNILNYLPNKIFKYGGSQSKLFQYLASGKPICSNLRMGYCLINKYRLGIAKEFNSIEEYAMAIKEISIMDKAEYEEMCKRSKEIAKDFDYSVLTKKLIDII